MPTNEIERLAYAQSVEPPHEYSYYDNGWLWEPCNGRCQCGWRCNLSRHAGPCQCQGDTRSFYDEDTEQWIYPEIARCGGECACGEACTLCQGHQGEHEAHADECECKGAPLLLPQYYLASGHLSDYLVELFLYYKGSYAAKRGGFPSTIGLPPHGWKLIWYDPWEGEIADAAADLLPRMRRSTAVGNPTACG